MQSNRITAPAAEKLYYPERLFGAVGRRFLVNKDYSDRIWETHCMNGEWRWNRGSLIDPGFMVNKKSFGRPPPQVGPFHADLLCDPRGWD